MQSSEEGIKVTSYDQKIDLSNKPTSLFLQ